MAENKSIIIRGQAGYCNIIRPLSDKVKFHRGMYKVQIHPLNMSDKVSDMLKERLKLVTAPNGEQVTTLTFYSKYPIKAFVDGRKVNQSDIMNNPTFGYDIAVEIEPYTHNTYGTQFAIKSVELPNEVLESNCPF